MQQKHASIFGFCSSLVLVGAALGGPPDLPFTEEIIDPVGSGDCKAVADVNGDGYPDLLLGGSPGEDLAWYAWPNWQRTVIGLAQVEFTTDMAAGDIDGDGDPDVVVGDGGSGSNLVWFRNPRPQGNPSDGGAWQRRTIGSATSHVKDVELADYNRDGRMDVAARTNGTVWIFFATSTGSWDRVSIRTGLTGEGMGSADIDGDGDADLVLPGSWLENPEPALDAASAAWPSRTIDSGMYTEAKVLAADLDGDGALEVAYSSSEGSHSVRWYDPGSDPRGPWAVRTIVSNFPGCHTLQAGDIDRDGDLDLALAQMHTHGGQILVALNNGGGQSWTQAPLGEGGIHNGVLADIDADGDLDLYGANWTGHPPARLWRNAGRVCPTDFNNDGDVNSSDIAIFLFAWVTDGASGGTTSDWNGDGAVTSTDISEYLGDWIDTVGGGCR